MVFISAGHFPSSKLEQVRSGTGTVSDFDPLRLLVTRGLCLPGDASTHGAILKPTHDF